MQLAFYAYQQGKAPDLPPSKDSSCNVRLELKIEGVKHGKEIAFTSEQIIRGYRMQSTVMSRPLSFERAVCQVLWAALSPVMVWI